MSESTDLAVVEARAVSMVDGPEPMAAIEYAGKLSTAIASVLKPGNGYDVIQGKKHVKAEGWQTIAAMTGHTVEVDWSRPVAGMGPVGGLHAWEARATVRDQHGTVVATGESMASPAERAPWNRADFSIRSMAQTRAMSRALASRMRYVVVLAGFAGAPAEEMVADDAPAKPSKAEVIASRQAEAEQRAGALGVTDFGEFFTSLGVSHPDQLYGDTKWRKVTAELDKRELAAEEAVEGEVVG